jgi:hypothetical protein
MPVIPMILVNGSDGIGTGWSSSVNNYDPRLIIANIRHMINGEAFEPMAPSYSGFTGEVSSFRFIIRLFAARYMLILIYFLSVKRLILKKTESFL